MSAQNPPVENELLALRARLASSEAEAEILRTELEETNHGVVALYAELDDRATQLREAIDLKGRFLLDGPLTTEQETQIRLMRRSVSELTEMVDDLLDLAKMDAGRITISPEWFEMVDLFSALRGIFRPIVANSSVSLIFAEPQAIPRIYTDDKKQSQILRNFISNALKFTTQGQVSVSANTAAAELVEFAVTDTRIGISSEHLPMLFNDFMQLDTRLQRRLRGTGLGLSLARKIRAAPGRRCRSRQRTWQGLAFLGPAPRPILSHT